jgi:hypothetical protein
MMHLYTFAKNGKPVTQRKVNLLIAKFWGVKPETYISCRPSSSSLLWDAAMLLAISLAESYDLEKMCEGILRQFQYDDEKAKPYVNLFLQLKSEGITIQPRSDTDGTIYWLFVNRVTTEVYVEKIDEKIYYESSIRELFPGRQSLHWYESSLFNLKSKIVKQLNNIVGLKDFDIIDEVNNMGKTLYNESHFDCDQIPIKELMGVFERICEIIVDERPRVPEMVRQELADELTSFKSVYDKFLDDEAEGYEVPLEKDLLISVHHQLSKILFSNKTQNNEI